MLDLNEARTRQQLIDKQLETAGWNPQSDSVGQEIPVDGTSPEAWAQVQRKLRGLPGGRELDATFSVPKGISDYVLYRDNGEIIAVVEAKRTSIDPRLAQAQAEFYVEELGKRQSFSPFAFLANGKQIYFIDVGNANKRLVHGFFAPEDLENLLYIRQNKKPLTSISIDTTITDRDYQIEAVRRVCEAFEQGKRKALLIMATGTGKTRTAMSLVSVFLRANQGRRILFVADREPLVEQARREGFLKYIPHEPTTRLFTRNLDTNNRLYTVTLQTLNNIFREFTPSFFDLIIFDEVHRSIFNKWNEVLQYFDARMVGLTATPAAFIDRNTFLQFECEGGVPTFLYSYDQAMEDGYLVDHVIYLAKTRFQRRGIRSVDLSEEDRNALIEQGLDPDEIDFTGTQLERDVSNRDTLRKQWQEIMDVCNKDQSGHLPGKTIVFAMTQAHALRLADVFEEMYPQYPGLLQVITDKSNYKGRLIDQFKKEDKPRIAITVDLLETGIDVPEVTNLVFMKPVHSRIKLEQMLGRGTRSQAACQHAEWLPEGGKKEFLVIDFWENEFNKSPQEELAQSVPVLVTIFNTRLKLLEHFLNDQESDEFKRTVAVLRSQVAEIPTDSFSVKLVLPTVEEAWKDSFWYYLTPSKIEFLRLKVGPLLRYAPGSDVAAATFISKIERLKHQLLSGKDATSTAQFIAEDVSYLPGFVYEDARRADALRLCLNPAKLQTATPEQLNQIIDQLADQMRNRAKNKPNIFIELDLPDYIETRGYVFLIGKEEPVHVEEYRKLVEQRVLDLVIGHPTIEAIEAGEEVSDQQLIELERVLRQELGEELHLSEQNIHRLYYFKVDSLLAFLRHILGLDGLLDYEAIISRQFDSFIAAHAYSGDQVRFLRTVKQVFVQKRRLRLADLYEPPLTSFGTDAADRLFSNEELSELLDLANQLSTAA